MTRVDAIVLDIDGGVMLEQCLASLRAQSMPFSRLIVVDNGSRSPVSERVGPVEVVRLEVNAGFAGGVNAGARRSDADLVALINNDVVLEPNWLATLHAAFQKDDSLAAAQTIIRRPDGRIDGAGIDISDGTFRQIGHGEPVGVSLAVAWGVSATAALYRREAVGPDFFDERFFAYYEDVDLGARLKASGWRVAVLPMVLATHRGSASAATLSGRALRLRTRNRYWVARKHRGVGSLGALLMEDLRLALRGETSPGGLIEGLFARLT